MIHLRPLLLALLPFSTLIGKVTFDFSSDTPKVLRSGYPAVRAAEMPPEKKIYTKEVVQYTHVATGLQYENTAETNMVDVSMNLGMSKKPLGVTESIYCFSFPKVMMYKKMHQEHSNRSTFAGAGMSYNGLINTFSLENARAIQAEVSMGLEFAGKNHANHIFQIELARSIRQPSHQSIEDASQTSSFPNTLIEFSYGADF